MVTTMLANPAKAATEPRRQAIIDIGSNSSRVVVFHVAEDAILEVLDEVSAPLRLVQALQSDGSLDDAAIDRTLAVLTDFVAVAHRWGVGRIQAVATAAVREASNQSTIIQRWQEKLGIEIAAIDGAREGELAFMGALAGVAAEDGLLVDLGGGSMQLVYFRDRRPQQFWSLPLGALRLSNRFLLSDPPAPAEMLALCGHVQATLSNAGLPRLGHHAQLVGTGGTIRNLARIDRRRDRYPIDRVRGYRLQRPAVGAVADLLARRSQRKRAAVPGIHEDRVDSIVGGALVVRTLLESVEAPELIVASTGLREGLMYDALGHALLSPLAARRAAIRALAGRFGTWSSDRSQCRSAWASALLAATTPAPTAEERETLEHAAWVLDIGRSIDFYRRHRHTATMLCQADLAGFDHRSLALLSAVVGAIGENRVRIAPLRPLLGPTDETVALRLARVLEVVEEVERRWLPASTSSLSCTPRGSVLILDAPLAGGAWLAETSRRFEQATGFSLQLAS